MKTVFINCSSKKRFCASQYFLFLQRMFTSGKKISEKLRNQADHARILDQLKDAQTVVFCLPLYVDGVPSHVLRFMEEMETLCRQNDIHLNVYCIANNGFIEGRQNEPLMQIFENFCGRAGLTWCGGVGIGGGVMLNVTRIVFEIQIVESDADPHQDVHPVGSLGGPIPPGRQGRIGDVGEQAPQHLEHVLPHDALPRLQQGDAETDRKGAARRQNHPE